MKHDEYPLQFLAVIQHTANVVEVEEVFFDKLRNNSKYQELCLELYSYPTEEHDIFWNVDDSLINSDLRLHQKDFSAYYIAIDMPVFYVYLNHSFCVLLIDHWKLFLVEKAYHDTILSIIEEIIIGLGTANKECVFAATDQQEDYSIFEKHILNTNKMLSFKSIKEIKDFFDATGVQELSNSQNSTLGYIYKNWNK
ncbi:hypothetical protein [Kordia sp.]|uniref:hypothetical protein n=1 Tax=Kordia sp. TaxID=1965332 RepID=UPI003B5C6EC7